jgi:hypothetical protein
LPPGIALNTTDGTLFGTPTQYIHRASLLIIPTDGDGNDGVAVNVIISVGPSSKPEGLAFSDTNPRPKVYSGDVVITPAGSEGNFTHYATYFTRAPDFIDQSMFDPAVAVTVRVLGCLCRVLLLKFRCLCLVCCSVCNVGRCGEPTCVCRILVHFRRKCLVSLPWTL